MSENVIHISEAQGASEFASLTARLRGRCGSRVRAGLPLSSRIAALEPNLQDVVVVPYDLELRREYGKVKASLVPGRVVAVNDLRAVAERLESWPEPKRRKPICDSDGRLSQNMPRNLAQVAAP
jgi:hypothetical protein